VFKNKSLIQVGRVFCGVARVHGVTKPCHGKVAQKYHKKRCGRGAYQVFYAERCVRAGLVPGENRCWGKKSLKYEYFSWFEGGRGLPPRASTTSSDERLVAHDPRAKANRRRHDADSAAPAFMPAAPRHHPNAEPLAPTPTTKGSARAMALAPYPSSLGNSKALTRPVRSSLPHPVPTPRSAADTARITTEYISWRYTNRCDSSRNGRNVLSRTSMR
jgi:hypothetical protein